MPRKILFLAALLLVSGVTPAQTSAQNHEKTTYTFQDRPVDLSPEPGSSERPPEILPVTASCIDVDDRKFLDCDMNWVIYYGVPNDGGLDADAIHRWSGGHDHRSFGDDPGRPVGSLQSELDPPSLNDPESRRVHGASRNRRWDLLIGAPEVSGNVTLSARVRLPPGYVVIEDRNWKFDGIVDGAQVARAAAAIDYRYRGANLRQLDSKNYFIKCGELQCFDSDTLDRAHLGGFSGTEAFTRSLDDALFFYALKNVLLDPEDRLMSTKKLRVVMLSAEWGGLYDRESNWSIPAITHRRGLNADVDLFALQTDYDPDLGQGTSHSEPADELEVRYYMENFGLVFRPAPGELVFHFIFDDQGTIEPVE